MDNHEWAISLSPLQEMEIRHNSERLMDLCDVETDIGQRIISLMTELSDVLNKGYELRMAREARQRKEEL